MLKHLNIRAIIALGLIFAFLANTCGPMPKAWANDFVLPAPGQMVPLSESYNPIVLKGIKLDPNNPFRFHFYVDTGEDVSKGPMGTTPKAPGVIASAAKQSQKEQLKQESTKLIKYFLASLTIPEKDLWVNLSPYEKDRIVPQEFGQTQMGRDLLAQDYLLKQITASLIYPESHLGKEFWTKIYAQAQAKYGTTNIPINTFNKVWIVPDRAVVYENKGTAFVLENHLQVMLEQDYLSLEKHTTVSLRGAEGDEAISKRTTNSDANALGSEITRQIVIPALTKEVNEGRNFSQLRQVFYSLILATWYKKKIRDSILNKIYSNQNKISGVTPAVSIFPVPSRSSRLVSLRGGEADEAIFKRTSSDVEYIYQQYLKAFKKGVYNYIKEDSVFARSLQGNEAILTRTTIPRKYFSGGVEAGAAAQAMIVVGTVKAEMAEELLEKSKIVDVYGNFTPIQMPATAAMLSNKELLNSLLEDARC